MHRVGVAEDALEQGAILKRADHVGQRLALPVSHHRQLRDAVALHRVDALADLRVRGDSDELGHLASVLRAQQLVDGRQRGLPLDEAVLEHPVVVVELRHVGAARVRNHRQDRRILAEAPRDLDRRPNGCAARCSHEQPLLPREPARGEKRIAVGHAHPLVHDGRIHCLRPGVLANPFDEVRVDALFGCRRVDRPFGIGTDDQHVGFALLEIAAHARDRSSGADRDDDRGEVAVRLVPDLRPCDLVVRLGIGHVRVLIRLEPARDLLRESVGDRVVRLRRIRRNRGGADDDLGAVRAQHGDLFLAHLVGHHEDAAVALLCRSDRQAGTGIARRRLHDRAARLQLPFLLGLLDHRQADAVLDGSAGIQVLELRKKLRRDVPGDRVQTDDRCLSDELQSGGILPGHIFESLVREVRDEDRGCR